jgi:hypothetical protein
MKPILLLLLAAAAASCTPGGHMDPAAAAELLHLARDASDTVRYIRNEK